MYEQMELLFPSRAIASLRDLRGEKWRQLVERVQAQPADSVEHLGFVLMMSRIVRCNTCSIDSQRAFHGCEVCARKALARLHADDDELLKMHQSACEEVVQFLSASQANRSG